MYYATDTGLEYVGCSLERTQPGKARMLPPPQVELPSSAASQSSVGRSSARPLQLDDQGSFFKIVFKVCFG